MRRPGPRTPEATAPISLPTLCSNRPRHAEVALAGSVVACRVLSNRDQDVRGRWSSPEAPLLSPAPSPPGCASVAAAPPNADALRGCSRGLGDLRRVEVAVVVEQSSQVEAVAPQIGAVGQVLAGERLGLPTLQGRQSLA